jgi:hypothetical protein
MATKALPGSATAVYRCFSASGELLYVGRTINVPARMQWHALNQQWWTLVTRIDLEWFASPRAAAAREIDTIRREHPKRNKAQKPDARQASLL